MKCKQCGNTVRVNFNGHCSTSCRDHKPMRIVPNPRYEYVDASVEDVMPLQITLKRQALFQQFKELRGEG